MSAMNVNFNVNFCVRRQQKIYFKQISHLIDALQTDPNLTLFSCRQTPSYCRFIATLMPKRCFEDGN